MFFAKGTKIKLFQFYNSDTSIGEYERQKVEKEVNDFLKEHNGFVSKIELQNNIIMVVYTDYD